MFIFTQQTAHLSKDKDQKNNKRSLVLASVALVISFVPTKTKAIAHGMIVLHIVSCIIYIVKC